MDQQTESHDLVTSNTWRGLTELQQKIAFVWFTEPWITRREVARRVGCSPGTVHMFFNSDSFRELSMELSRYEFKELVYLAVKSLKECLLDRDSKIKLSAAVRVLETEGLLGAPVRVSTDSNKSVINVKWSDIEKQEIKQDS